MNRIIIIGATSGIGREVARLFAEKGWKVGIAGRRQQKLDELQQLYPQQIVAQTIDITRDDSPSRLQQLIDRFGGMDIFLLCSGIGSQNYQLDPVIELNTLQTNGVGFTRMLTTAWHYFRTQRKGHIAAISSIAGTKGLGAAPAYSATKRFQNCYIDALAQLSQMEDCHIRFTDIRPGFVDTDLLKHGNYPLLMQADKVAQTIVSSLLKGKRRVIIDWRYRILVFIWKLIPDWLWEKLPIRN